ncbi:NACHT domain-containing protein [Coleofasciculus sp. FACHB-SPT9]|uniref:NACHT domain-containing protein n=1 Tax=Cyanophyceae TaxID=3028117 RepID=UPI001686E087|nr:NACHT domain-containing protein [Coleofasciculus sp. FACHB-SPT9]MBD1888849.1 NACHT domain-containing protein [Coleofasciculus sp. FACHB-SPT9]
MEFWDGWDNFLKVIASDHNLTVEQKAVFLVRFARQNIDKKNQDVADEVIGGEPAKALRAYDKRMKDIFGKLAESFPEVKSEDKGKVKRVQAYLEKAYLEQQQNKDTEAGSAIASHDWTKICRDMLESQKLNIRRQATEVVSKAFYVELGLVERKHQPRRSGDFSVSPEQGSGFFQLHEEEITQTYEHHEFLEQVIKQGQSKKSQGKRIAIIGEPGAGKTTLLEAIAFSPKTPGFPIWVSLGSLRDKSLENYVRENWLKDALKTSNVTQQQKALEELFKSGEVLLLLDGVDEMPASSPVEALAKLREELTGWVADARTVLTCRQNVWDASVNALPGFDTYRTLDFSYEESNKPDQVRQFLWEWFSQTDKPELGERLREKLDEDRHQRVRDLVKNPLRLSLLCQSWYFRQGDLPKTKAALYEQFTRAFYDWKQEQFSTTETKRKELNTALGLLAQEAIDKEKSRFGIREGFAIDVMGEDLFKLASKLHWLVEVYKDIDTGKPVYAFFHPTFQEYFAACAIDNWHFFMNHIFQNPKDSKASYRIFEPQWKEVIMLWLGREVDKEFKRQKEAFIDALVEFPDRCGYFYSYKAYCLAAGGIAEFWDCKRADGILTQIFQWGFGNHNGEGQKEHYLIENAARKVFEETDRTRAINLLTQLISDAEEVTHTVQGVQFHLRSDADNTWEAARILIKIDPGNQLGERVLANTESLMLAIGLEKDEVMCLSRGLPFQGKPRRINLTMEPESLDAIRAINKEFENFKNQVNYQSLGNGNQEYLDKVNSYFIEKLTDLLTTSKDLAFCMELVRKLQEIDRCSMLSVVVKCLKNFLQGKTDEDDYSCNWQSYEVVWHCAQNMTYPDFYQAWHGDSSAVQALEN